METVTIPKEEYESLKKKADVDESLLMKLVRGLEDIKLAESSLGKGNSQIKFSFYFFTIKRY